MKSKTIAAWLAFVGGPLGLHRFYLHGPGDMLGWLLPIPTALGVYGLQRVRQFGVDDAASWVLLPIAGFAFAACALTAIVYGLTDAKRWNARHNPGAPADAGPGRTRWATIFAVVLALLIGTTVLMSSIVYSFQRYFEVQVEEGRRISQ